MFLESRKTGSILRVGVRRFDARSMEVRDAQRDRGGRDLRKDRRTSGGSVVGVTRGVYRK